MKELYNLIFSLPPKQLTLVAVLLGFLLLDDLSANEQNTLGNFLMLIGQVLETSATQMQYLQGLQSNNMNSQIINDINRIKRKLNID